MSEQLDLHPRFVVLKDIRAVQIGQWDDAKGYYRACMVMQYPYDRYQAALVVCEALNTLEVELETEGDKPEAVPNVGLNVRTK